jgi:hypothetical protein
LLLANVVDDDYEHYSTTKTKGLKKKQQQQQTSVTSVHLYDAELLSHATT